MQDPENATLCLAGLSPTWPDLKNVQISEITETLSRQSKELYPDFSKGLWTLVRFSTEKILPEDFDLDLVLSVSGITINMVPNIVEHKDSGSYELVVARSCLNLLSERFPDFNMVVDYDPSEPAEVNIRIHGLYEANKRAQVNLLNNAVEAICNGWGCGPAECYRNTTGKVGLGTALERSILNRDIQQSNPQVLKHFSQNLLFLCLNLLEHYDTAPALELLARDQNDWLQPFHDGHTGLSDLLMAADARIRTSKRSERQTILLFRSLLEFSGGKVDCRQHSFDFDYTVSQNASLCAHLLGISSSRRFGHFDPKEMRDALSKSRLFAEASSPAIPDTLDRSLRMMALVPVGFPDDYLNLPSQLLCGFGAQQVKQLVFFFGNIYHRLPSLRKQKNNILLLLSWSHTIYGQTLKVLIDWAKSEESLHLFQRLIEDLRLQQTPGDFALTLAALLCRERLLPCTIDEIAQPVGDNYLTNFNAIINGQDISSKRTVFEQMIMSLLRVLYTLEDSKDLLQLLAEVFDKWPSLLTPSDGVADQYCARKLHGHTHNRAVVEANEVLLESAKAILKSDMNADDEWMVIPRDSR